MEQSQPIERRRRFGVLAAIIGISAVSLTAAISLHDPRPSGNTSTASSNPNSLTEQHETYPLHQSVTATVFWVGEAADNSNDFIHNRSSAWVEDWQSAYGGVDDPEDRCGHHPCAFTPLENPFYFALPYNDLTDEGARKPSATNIPWYKEVISAHPLSVVKNRWVKITHGEESAYAQWEDSGPFFYDDFDYVFGDGKPTSTRAGIDLSPATANLLHIDGRGIVSWQFVDEAQVPAGPWREIITTRN